MSDLWWCLEMHTIMPAYSFSFCSLSARIAPSHFSYISQAPVWVQDCVGICCDVISQCLCPSSLHLPCELAPSPLKSLPFPGPSPPERADKVAFCASPLHRVIILCAGNLFVIGLLPSQIPSSLRAETFHFSWCRAHCCLVAKLCLTLCNRMGYTAHQAPLSMGFPRQEYWSGISFFRASSRTRDQAQSRCSISGLAGEKGRAEEGRKYTSKEPRKNPSRRDRRGRMKIKRC